MIEDDVMRLEFFKQDDFGVPVVIAGQTYTGIFDAPYQAIGLGPDLEASGAFPTVLLRSVDAQGADYGTTVVVNSTSYRVREIMPDGTGLTVLGLEVA